LSTVAEDTASIVLPVSSVDTDRDWGDSDGVHQLVTIVRRNGLVTGDLVTSETLFGSVTSIGLTASRNIGILGVGGQRMSLDVSVSGDDVTSVATIFSVRSSSARNNLLFRQVRRSGVFGDGVGRVDGFDSGKGPARSALTLIQNGDDFVL